MPTWEYLLLTWQGHNVSYGNAQNILVRSSDGQLNATKMRSHELAAIVNRLGVEGWEMVNVYAQGEDFSRVWFKRPKLG